MPRRVRKEPLPVSPEPTQSDLALVLPAAAEPLGPLASPCSHWFRAAFPGPGQALAAAGLLMASTTLAHLGLVALEARSTVGTAETRLRPIDDELLAAGMAVALVPPSLAPSAPSARELHAEEAPPAPPGPLPEPLAPAEVPRLSRVVDPASSPSPTVPPVEAPAEPPASTHLHRLPRPEVLAAADPPEAPQVVVPSEIGALPLGKGMWLYLPEKVEDGDVDALVERARHVGLTHVYVRTGSSRAGFYAQAYLDQLLPKAHAGGIRVYGWDFTYLDDVGADVARSLAAITYTTPTGDRIDGFAADIETASEGTNLTPEGAAAYGQGLRAAVGPAYPLVAVVPRPSPLNQARYPYEAVIPPFDAVAPMTYWLNRQPDSDVVNDVSFLAPFAKPVVPIGQAYDGLPEGGRPGPPPPEEIQRFLTAADQIGATGVSFWSWQDVTQAIWDTIQAAPEFRWEAGAPGELRGDQVRGLQTQLTHLGHPVAASGGWDDATTTALAAYQERAHLPITGVLDTATLAVLLAPFNPPVSALGG